MINLKKVSMVFLISVFFIVSVIGILLYKIDNEEVPANNVLLFNDFYFYKSDWMHSKIYAKDRFDAEKGYKYNSSIFEGWIYKYSYDKENGFIAARIFDYIDDTVNSSDHKVLYERWFGHNQYKIIEDDLIMYNSNTKEHMKFNSDEELENYCTSQEIKLTNWYYIAGNGPVEETSTSLLGNYRLKTWLFDYSSIMLNEEELIYGYITDVKVKDNTISFRLRLPEPEYSPENINANKELSGLSNKPVGKYRTDFLNYQNIYYDKIITINTINGNIIEN